MSGRGWDQGFDYEVEAKAKQELEETRQTQEKKISELKDALLMLTVRLERQEESQRIVARELAELRRALTDAASYQPEAAPSLKAEVDTGHD